MINEEHNNIILDLLFTLSEWMSLVKLRLMTEEHRQILREVTTALGYQLRRFKSKVCKYYKTKDLPPDETARGKKENGPYPESVENEDGVKKFNLKRFKLHSLGHYVESILQFGTTDSYTTQLVSNVLYSHPLSLTYRKG